MSKTIRIPIFAQRNTVAIYIYDMEMITLMGAVHPAYPPAIPDHRSFRWVQVPPYPAIFLASLPTSTMKARCSLSFV